MAPKAVLLVGGACGGVARRLRGRAANERGLMLALLVALMVALLGAIRVCGAAAGRGRAANGR